mmetsp:Transcript_55754/g.178924  ORF Transcript_55754/g.178924 Transcript_55754/m.178924 type:complete len:201 (-) Transcript_55754:429-1031(-)
MICGKLIGAAASDAGGVCTGTPRESERVMSAPRRFQGSCEGEVIVDGGRLPVPAVDARAVGTPGSCASTGSGTATDAILFASSDGSSASSGTAGCCSSRDGAALAWGAASGTERDSRSPTSRGCGADSAPLKRLLQALSPAEAPPKKASFGSRNANGARPPRRRICSLACGPPGGKRGGGSWTLPRAGVSWTRLADADCA